MQSPQLIPRYPGSKRRAARYPVWDGHTYDLAVVPFGGGLGWSQPALNAGHVRRLIVADIDPAVRAVYWAWAGQEPGVEKVLNGWVELMLLPPFNRLEPQIVFDHCCSLIDGEMEADRCVYAAAKILLHKLTFGGNVRANAQGKLNVSLRTDWDKALAGYTYTLPYCPTARVLIRDNWQAAFRAVSGDNVIAFIDPPYYAPGNGPRVKGGMSRAYSAHGGEPRDRAVLDMFLDAVSAAVCDPRIRRVVATNYYGHWLETIAYDSDGVGTVQERAWVDYSETTGPMRDMGFEWFHDLGPLQAMNNRDFNEAKAGTVEQRTIRHEGWWELGGVRQHGRVQQMSLLEVA